MKVLVLGASGYIGKRLVQALADSGWAAPVAASRSASPGSRNLRLDATDAAALEQALQGVDAVVNCVAGSAGAISGGAATLVEAARRSGCRQVVPFSSLSVYGEAEGEGTEEGGRGSSIGRYRHAQKQAGHEVGGV